MSDTLRPIFPHKADPPSSQLECDIVGLVCLETSVSGGESLLASSSAVFSYLREHDPAALEILMKPFYWDRKDEQRPGDAPYGVSPIFLYLPPASPASPGRVAVFHDRNFLRTAHRLGLPRLTTEQERALDALHDACDKLAFHMVLSKGDFQLVHNHQMLHDRMGFQDGPGKQRHLLRLWITREGPRGDWEIPRDLLEVRSVFDAPGRTAPLEAE